MKVQKKERVAIVKRLEVIMKKYGADKVRTVSNRYFLNMKERIKAQQRITALQEEVAILQKKAKA